MNIYKQLKKKHFEDNVLSALDEFTSLNRKHSTNPEEFLVEARRWYSSKYDGQLDVSKDEAVGYLNESSLMKLERMSPGSKHSLKLVFWNAISRFIPQVPKTEQELMTAIEKVLGKISPSAMYIVQDLTEEDLKRVLSGVKDFTNALSDELLQASSKLTVDDLVDILDRNPPQSEENQEQQETAGDAYRFSDDGNEIKDGYFQGFPDRLIQTIKRTIAPVLNEIRGMEFFSDDLMTQPLIDIDAWTELLMDQGGLEDGVAIKNWPSMPRRHGPNHELAWETVYNDVKRLSSDLMKEIKRTPELRQFVLGVDLGYFSGVDSDPAIDIITYYIAVSYLSRKHDLKISEIP